MSEMSACFLIRKGFAMDDERLRNPPLDGTGVPDHFDELLARSDFVSVHAPLNDETRHMVDAALIDKMIDGVSLVNTARGPLVEPDALLAALDSGKVRAAALDVTEPEPLPAEHPLLDRDDVIITPHVSSATTAGRRRLYAHAIDNVLDALAGKQPAGILNPEVWPGRCGSAGPQGTA